MKYKLKILQDEFADSPRNWDNVGIIACYDHRRYDLGDEKIPSNDDDFEEFINMLKRDDVYYLPIYMYDHSGIALNTTGFTCQFDSSQAGYIYTTKERVLSMGFSDNISDEQVYDILRGEIETYSQYINGDVYYFILDSVSRCDTCGHEHYNQEDSCGGFYGTDWENNGIKDHIPKEAWYLLKDIEVEYGR